jgi:hypothetical protein
MNAKALIYGLGRQGVAYGFVVSDGFSRIRAMAASRADFCFWSISSSDLSLLGDVLSDGSRFSVKPRSSWVISFSLNFQLFNRLFVDEDQSCPRSPQQGPQLLFAFRRSSNLLVADFVLDLSDDLEELFLSKLARFWVA